MRLRHAISAAALAVAAIFLLGSVPSVGAAEQPAAIRPLTTIDDAARAAAGRTAHRAAAERVRRLSRTRARLTSESTDRGASRAELASWSKPRLRAHAKRLRAAVRELRRTGGAPDVAIPAALHAIAQCESGGDPAAVSADGTYRGLFQFDAGTWASVGGSGDPAAASSGEQYRRAAMLFARAGASPWPVCGR